MVVVLCISSFTMSGKVYSETSDDTKATTSDETKTETSTNTSNKKKKKKKVKMNKKGYVIRRCKLKTDPDSKSKTIATIKINSRVRYGKYNKKWAKIKYKKKTGYIKLRNIRKSKYLPSYFKRMGVIHWNGWRWTWYSQKVLHGCGLRIPGRHVDGRGFVCDRNGYICLASSVLRRGKVLSTPFGKKGKVYDSGCSSNTIDVYVNW